MKYTKSWGNVLVAAREHHDELVNSGDVNEQDMRYILSKAARKEEAKRLVNEAGLSLRDAAKALGVSHDTIARDVSENLTNGVAKSDKSTRELLSQSDQNDWRTPRKYLDAARQTMGGIDLDPASSAEANETVAAEIFYTEKDNGLQLPWKGRLWLNPPYGGDARLFIERLIREYQVGNVVAACTLVNSHPTETKWFQQLFDYSICFVRGRIDFGGPSRAVSSTSTHGSAIAYLGNDIESFAKEFSQFGAVVRRI